MGSEESCSFLLFGCKIHVAFYCHTGGGFSTSGG